MLAVPEIDELLRVCVACVLALVTAKIRRVKETDNMGLLGRLQSSIGVYRWVSMTEICKKYKLILSFPSSGMGKLIFIVVFFEAPSLEIPFLIHFI